MKTFKQAPLPFVGQKRNFIQLFKEALTNVPKDGAGWTIVDVFGGSGLLAHIAKREKPVARVIYNDFDNYVSRLENISATNDLRDMLAALLSDYPRYKLIDNATKQKIIEVIKTFNKTMDLKSVGNWLLHSGKRIEIDSLDYLLKQTLYNCLRKSPIPSAEGYLDGLEIVHESFDTLLPKFTNQHNVLLVLDPPYVNTAQNTYRNDTDFGVVSFLKLMAHIKPPFILFSSSRSELKDYLAYLKEYEPEKWQKFDGATIRSRGVTLAKNVCYEDNMLWKF